MITLKSIHRRVLFSFSNGLICFKTENIKSDFLLKSLYWSCNKTIHLWINTLKIALMMQDNREVKSVMQALQWGLVLFFNIAYISSMKSKTATIFVCGNECLSLSISFSPCNTAWRSSSDYCRNNDHLCKFPLRD